MNYFILTFVCLFGLTCGYYDFDMCSGRKDGEFLKDYTSCGHYIVCIDGLSLYGQCPDELHFSEKDSYCNYPEFVECGEVCPREGIHSFAVERSCSRYVRCIQGEATYEECPSGLYYDKHSGHCNVKAEVDCEEDICANPGYYLFPSHENCSVYFQCHDHELSRRECANGLYFNEHTKTCDLRSNVVCLVPEPKEEELDDVAISCPPSGTHFYPHPSDCTHYFLCLNGISSRLYCGYNLHYDFTTEKCDLPEKAQCIVNYI